MRWDTRRERWAAIICLPRKRIIQIAQFDDERDAALAHDRVALQLLGPDALRNFPRKRLAPATLAEARAEARRLYKERTSSKYRGVTWSKKERCWTAQIAHRKKSHRLGSYTSELKAARAYDRAAAKMHGARAVLNFPS